MKKEGTIGAAAFLAFAAVVGVSLQSGPKQGPSGRTEQGALLRRPAQASRKPQNAALRPGCQYIEEQLQEFLGIEDSIAPPECYPNSAIEIPNAATKKTSQLKFVIATLPDPLHTHLSVLFDQFTVAVQDAAQDEKYEFDGSWLPWEDEPESYALLKDQQDADLQKELREEQPGILLFRRAFECPHSPSSQTQQQQAKAAQQNGCSDLDQQNKSRTGEESSPSARSYREGLAVFVVGEEATHGIHKDQFRNALNWIDALEPAKTGRKSLVGILGPTFSGSLPSLAQVLDDPAAQKELTLHRVAERLAIYSGSISGKSSAETFQDMNPGASFHSFVQSDDLILKRFCNYMTEKQSEFDARKLAILSEDETAYGKSGYDASDCSLQALNLFYPRDISALRGAYQTKALFDTGPGSPPPDLQRRSLPTDLADPAGKVHDSIRSYGGNQTPLVQEAFLLEIVAALRDLHARYILLRGSNILDQLFLANFLRRMYPSGRIVILSSDLLFIRERGATGLNGAMTLTNYPLFPLTRDWTEHDALHAADRAFSSDTSEGTYIAFRVLLNAGSVNNQQDDLDGCRLADDQERIFVPEVVCKGSPIPDYLPPYWMVPDDCPQNQGQSRVCNYSGPATWLTVIGINRFWPIASLTLPADSQQEKKVANASPQKVPGSNSEPTKTSSRDKAAAHASETPPGSNDQLPELGRKLQIPPGMKAFFLILAAFSIFHAWCCGAGSYTAKPNFRAHFASTGDWRHALLVFSGSCILAFLAIVAGSGCGAFSEEALVYMDPRPALYCLLFVCFMTWVSIIARSVMVWRLSVQRPKKTREFRSQIKELFAQTAGFFVANSFAVGLSSILFLAILLFFFGFHVLWPKYLHVLGNSDRALTYWRAMHLSSGVSPIVPFIAILAGLYLRFWLTLHGLALFGPDRPCLPSKEHLRIKIKIKGKKDEEGDLLRMFSQEDAALRIEEAGMPFTPRTAKITVFFLALLLIATRALADGASLRGLGVQFYPRILMIWLAVCVSLQLAGAWRLYGLWEELRQLLTFLDRLPLRRTLAVMRGISWDNVWKMSGNVLEVRYKVISRQIESMNHSISALEKIEYANEAPGVSECLTNLRDMRTAGIDFARWYSDTYGDPHAGDLTTFGKFQRSVALAAGTLLTQLLIPAWNKETNSLILLPLEEKSAADKDAAAPTPPPQAKQEHIRNAEEFVCLTYLGFIQNTLGRLRTLAMTIVALFFATTIALSTYPFDPRQVLSAILIALFAILGIVIVKVYAEMHRDATLSHVTNTKPGELGPEFWFKVLAFGFAPLVGLLTRIFPGISDFIFSWIQPGISSLK